MAGEGNAAAATLTERSIAMFRPWAVIFVGAAGALKNDVNLGDVLASISFFPLMTARW